MKLIPTEIPEVLVLEPKIHGDHRGFFMEIWRDEWFENAAIPHRFVQENHSKSSKGILRGLHYQLRQPQGKLVRVVAGEIFDVAVDMRPVSPTFGKWVGRTLSADNKLALWVPPGFAHGFYVTGEEAEVIYKCTEYYAPDDEYGLLWNDPDLAIDWPVEEGEVILSEKDRQANPFVHAPLYNHPLYP